MRLALLLFALLLAPIVALAQGAVTQVGPTTQQHVGKWVGNGQLNDAGNYQASTVGSGISDLPLVNSLVSNPLCLYDASPATSPAWHALCLGSGLSGSPLFTYDAFGTATPQAPQCRVNGTLYPCFPSGGNVAGPGSSTNADLPTFNGTSGALLADSGVPIGALSACESILAHGGKGDNSTDNTAAFNAAKAVNGCVLFPPGKFVFLSALTYTLPSITASFSIIGAAANNTQLIWPNAVGTALTVTEIHTNNSIHFRHFSMQTGQNNSDTGVLLTTTYNPGVATGVNASQSDITDVEFRGSDGYSINDQWTTAVHTLNVGNLNVFGGNLYGANGNVGGWATAVQGNGYVLEGTGIITLPTVYNFSGINTYLLNSSVQLKNSVQGVVIHGGSNFTGGNNCVYAPSGGAAFSQLDISDSQFNCRTAVNLLATVPGFIFHDNTCIEQTLTSGNPPVCVNLGFQPAYSTIHNNIMNGTGNGGIGVAAAANFTGAVGGTISGNIITANTIGVELLTGAKQWTVSGNQYFANTSDVVSDVGANVVDIPLDCTSGISLNFGAGNTGITYAAKGCSYFQIGKQVTVTLNIGLTSKGSSTGNASITGLPVTSSSAAEFGNAAVMTYSGLSSASGILGVVGQGSSTMSLLIPGATATANAADTNFTNNAILDVKVNYRTP